MTGDSIRADIVALLIDLRPGPESHPGRWTRRDGRPLTPEESELVGSATRSEVQAAADWFHRAVEHDTEQVAAHERILEITGPYFTRLPAGSVMADVLPLLTPDERAEYDRLAELVAPDGFVVIPSTDPDSGSFFAIAAHVAANFAVDITHAPRGSHDDMFGPFEPATTAARLFAEYQAIRDRADAIPPGTAIPVPAMAVMINDDGHDLYVQLDKRAISDPAEQANAILTELAEALALEQAAAEARQRAIGLMALFEETDNR